MIRANKELDLLRSYRRLMRGEKGRSGLLHHFLTPAALYLLSLFALYRFFFRE